MLAKDCKCTAGASNTTYQPSFIGHGLPIIHPYPQFSAPFRMAHALFFLDATDFIEPRAKTPSTKIPSASSFLGSLDVKQLQKGYCYHGVHDAFMPSYPFFRLVSTPIFNPQGAEMQQRRQAVSWSVLDYPCSTHELEPSSS